MNTAGAVTDSYGYSAFGEMASHTGSTVNPFLFNAQQFDGASGDYFLRARYYDQSNGRFLSQDPYEGNSQDPITLHRYLYAGNDPVSFSDPNGEEFSLPGIMVSISVSTILGGVLGATTNVGGNRAKAGLFGALYGFEGATSLVYANSIGKLGTTILGGFFGAFIAMGVDYIAELKQHHTPYDLKRLPLVALEGFSTAASATAIGEGADPFGQFIDTFTTTHLQDTLDQYRDSPATDFPSPTEGSIKNILSDALLQGTLAYATAKATGGILGPVAKEAEELTKGAREQLETQAENAATIVVGHFGAAASLLQRQIFGEGPEEKKKAEPGSSAE